LKKVAFACQGYDQRHVEADPQVLLPLRHLEDFVAKGIVGDLSPIVVSFCGCQPNAIRVVKELIPAVLQAATEFGAQSALLVPGGRLCIQTMGLVARAFELNGIPAVLTSWSGELAQMTAPPRTAVTNTGPGSTLGRPGDHRQQRHVLESTLNLLTKDAPLDLVDLDGT
jgi:hypothetical protein